MFKKLADSVIVPEFTPRSGVKIQINDNDPAPGASGSAGSSLSMPFQNTLNVTHFSSRN